MSICAIDCIVDSPMPMVDVLSHRSIAVDLLLLAAASPPSAGRARRSASGEAGNIISRSVGGSGSRIEDNNNNKTASLIFHKRINKKTERNAEMPLLCVRRGQELSGVSRVKEFNKLKHLLINYSDQKLR